VLQNLEKNKELKMRITTLIENTKLENRNDLIAEHGLSLNISFNDKNILFDTGATDAFSKNAEKLEVDIQKADMAVISHHHYDHGGGLALFLEKNKAKIYMKQYEEKEHYFKALGIIKKHIGLDKNLFSNYPNRFSFVNKFTEISPDVFILTKIEKQYPMPKGNSRLFAKKGNICELDKFEHELIMVIKQENELVVFTGCSHNGILNMIDTVVKKFQGVRIKALFGGFHLVGVPIMNTMAGSKKEVEGIGKDMLKYPIDKVYTGHCTGIKAYQVLKNVMGDKLDYCPTGSIIEV
jgi:7,8-dihydropterin-6-yl-methyl-4-(beta-D-ribofuranosyl)aminobenzene 5'-phosphate synthase